MDKKLVPITGRHTTFHSMAAEAMIEPTAVSGLVIYFEEDGTMHFGEVNLRASNCGMAQMYLQKLAVDFMNCPDD